MQAWSDLFLHDTPECEVSANSTFGPWHQNPYRKDTPKLKLCKTITTQTETIESIYKPKPTKHIKPNRTYSTLRSQTATKQQLTKREKSPLRACSVQRRNIQMPNQSIRPQTEHSYRVGKLRKPVTTNPKLNATLCELRQQFIKLPQPIINTLNQEPLFKRSNKTIQQLLKQLELYKFQENKLLN